MRLITHRYAPGGGRVAVAAMALAFALPATPSMAQAQVSIPVGHLEVAGTVTYSDAPGCPGQDFAESATAVGAVVDPVGTYAGTVNVTASGSSIFCDSLTNLAIDTGTFTLSVSGTTGASTIVCRDYQSPASAPAPMPGIYFRIGEILILGSDGICNINGSDSAHEQVYQTLVFAPTGVSTSSLLYSGGAVAGDLRIGV